MRSHPVRGLAIIMTAAMMVIGRGAGRATAPGKYPDNHRSPAGL